MNISKILTIVMVAIVLCGATAFAYLLIRSIDPRTDAKEKLATGAAPEEVVFDGTLRTYSIVAKDVRAAGMTYRVFAGAYTGAFVVNLTRDSLECAKLSCDDFR